MKKTLICGAGGFIGSHMVKYLKNEGYWVRGVDLKYPEFSETKADDFVIGDLREQNVCRRIFDRRFDEVYQFAADMGGAGYVFTGEHDAEIVHNSALINLNIVECCYKRNVNKVFFSSSACIYPQNIQEDPWNPGLQESMAYPADPDSDYGWEKLFSEKLYLAFHRNYGLDVKIARYHNIFGPEGTWFGGREKAPAALCRKVALAENGGTIEVWGDGEQTRSFLYIDTCIHATKRLMDSDCNTPLNIGSTEMVSINRLAEIVMEVAGKKVKINHITENVPLGVRGRNSHNELIKKILGFNPEYSLKEGISHTYKWIKSEINKKPKIKFNFR